MEKDISKSSEDALVNTEERLIAEIPKDGLKALFHLFVGRPDSEELVLYRIVKITQDDILRLYEKINEKLENHHVFSTNSKIDVSFENGKTKLFGSWEEYKSFDWIISEMTTEIFIKFDFLVTLPSFSFPQRHALSVRIMSSPNPIRVLRSMLSSDPEEIDSIENMKGPIVCRVDFINNVLAKELLEIVKDWNSCCKKAFFENKFIIFLQRNSRFHVYFFKFLTLLVMSILSVAILFKLTSDISDDLPATFGNLKLFVIWGLFTAIGLGLVNEIRKVITNYSMNAFEKYNRKFIIFDLTNGDKEKQRELATKNSKHIVSFIIGSSINFIINIIAGIVVYNLLK